MRRTGPVMINSTVRRASAAVLGVLLAVGGTALAAPAAAAPPEKTAVIVQLTPDSDAAAESRKASANGGGSVSHIYTEVFRGFAGSFNGRALEGLRRNPRVALIEADGVATVSASQAGATWGLDRIDQRARPLSTTYDYTGTGTGVTAYIVDTGIAPNAIEFEDGLAPGMTVFTDGYGTTDCNGHGTHVAGTVGGETYGVAKEVTLVPVRVLDCAGSGSWSGVIAGLDWVAAQHAPGTAAVANLSLGGSRNSSVDAAVQRVIDDGVTVAVAAGNSNINACNTSPARVPAALTTGATDAGDRRASFSNYGSCLDLFAPGVQITSTWLDGSVNTISGTSMAAPHVAGVAALRLERAPAASPASIAAELVTLSTKNVVSSAGAKSPNRLLYSPPAD